MVTSIIQIMNEQLYTTKTFQKTGLVDCRSISRVSSTLDKDLYLPVLDSIVVSIPACHAGDPGSIPGRGVSFVSSLPKHTLHINRLQGNHTSQAIPLGSSCNSVICSTFIHLLRKKLTAPLLPVYFLTFHCSEMILQKNGQRCKFL